MASPEADRLERVFGVNELSKVMIEEIAGSRTYEGWFCLVVMLDLFSRKVIRCLVTSGCATICPSMLF